MCIYQHHPEGCVHRLLSLFRLHSFEVSFPEQKGWAEEFLARQRETDLHLSRLYAAKAAGEPIYVAAPEGAERRRRIAMLTPGQQSVFPKSQLPMGHRW